jgi:hypothetical protein
MTVVREEAAVPHEERLRTTIRRLAETRETHMEEGREYVFLGRVIGRVYGEADEVVLHWFIRGVPCVLEFRLEVEDLAPSRPRCHFREALVLLHVPAPPWMVDRPCTTLGGLFCQCVPSDSAGQEMARWLVERSRSMEDAAEAVWSPLLELYRAATEPGYAPDAAGVDRARRALAADQGRKGGLCRDTPLERLLLVAASDRE